MHSSLGPLKIAGQIKRYRALRIRAGPRLAKAFINCDVSLLLAVSMETARARLKMYPDRLAGLAGGAKKGRLPFGNLPNPPKGSSQWCIKRASKIMIGSGIPNNHNNAPFPKPMALLHWFSR